MGPVRMEPGKQTTDAWISRIETALGHHVDGGYRAAVREVLIDAFTHGLTYNGDLLDREKGQDEPAKGSPTTSEPRRVLSQGVDYTKLPDAREEAVGALQGWWEQTAHDEVAQLTAKMTEYGGLSRATDLTAIGQDLVAAGVTMEHQGDDFEARLQELGIYFYVRGKFARWQAAIIEGRPVSDDTLLDIGIYVRMAQRVRAVGGWPV